MGPARASTRSAPARGRGPELRDGGLVGCVGQADVAALVGCVPHPVEQAIWRNGFLAPRSTWSYVPLHAERVS